MLLLFLVASQTMRNKRTWALSMAPPFLTPSALLLASFTLSANSAPCNSGIRSRMHCARATHRALCSLFASPPSWRALTLSQRGLRPGQAQARQAAKCLQSCAAASATCARGPPRQHRTGWKGQAVQLAHNAEVAQRAAAPGRHRPVQPRCRQAHHACHDNLIRGRLHAPCKGCSASQPQLQRIRAPTAGCGSNYRGFSRSA